MDFEDVVGYALRIGVIISAIFLVTGLLLIFVKSNPAYITNEFLYSNSSTVNAYEIPVRLTSLNFMYFLYFGLIVLIATPIMRVLIGIFQFVRERNWIYVIITAIVFFNLMVAIFILPKFMALILS